MNLKQLLNIFNLREIEKELTEKLFEAGPLGASELAKKVGISRTSIYDLLDKLIKIGLVFQTLDRGVKKFCIQKPEKIKLLLEEKQKNISSAQDVLKNIEQEYQNKNFLLKPNLQLYSGKQELQQMMKDMLLYRDIEVLAYWPILDMLKILNSSFLKKFHQERIKRNISLKTIWSSNQIPDFKKYSYLKAGEEFKREVKILPKIFSFSLGYVIYKHTVRFLSSSKENFGFLIESQELTETMRTQFEIIWQQSKKL